jgi:hypothetical protein
VNSEIAEKDVLRAQLMRSSGAAVGIAGGSQSLRELEIAAEAGTPIIPIAASGGWAAIAWNGIVGRTWVFEPHEIYGCSEFMELADPERGVDAAVALLRTVLDSI